MWAPIPSDKVYLYIRPQPGGGKGDVSFSQLTCSFLFITFARALKYNITNVSLLYILSYFANVQGLLASRSTLWMVRGSRSSCSTVHLQPRTTCPHLVTPVNLTNMSRLQSTRSQLHPGQVSAGGNDCIIGASQGMRGLEACV